MSNLLETCENGSPSMSKAEDNLSNSDGPLLKKNIGQILSSCETRKTPLELVSNENSSFNSFDFEKKRYCLWLLIIILLIIGLGNLIVTVTVITVLRLSQGMESLQVISSENLVKFYGQTDLDRICIEKGVCQGYGDEPVELTSFDSDIHFNVKNHRHDHLRGNFWILKNGTTVSQIESFQIKDPSTNDVFFSTDFPNFELPSGVDRINVQLAQTHRIISPINDTLNIESNKKVLINGAESVNINSKEIAWMADKNMILKSNNNIIIDGGKNGIYIDVKKIPLSNIDALLLLNTDQSQSQSQYKICICMPQGKLFKVPISPGNLRINCAKVNTNPCL